MPHLGDMSEEGIQLLVGVVVTVTSDASIEYRILPDNGGAVRWRVLTSAFQVSCPPYQGRLR